MRLLGRVGASPEQVEDAVADADELGEDLGGLGADRGAGELDDVVVQLLERDRADLGDFGAFGVRAGGVGGGADRGGAELSGVGCRGAAAAAAGGSWSSTSRSGSGSKGSSSSPSRARGTVP